MSFTVIIGVLLFLVFGLINVFSPNTGWYLSTGWRFKDAEPSDFALQMHRLGGFGLIAAFVIIIVITVIH